MASPTPTCTLKKAARRAMRYLNVNRTMMTLKPLQWSDALYELAQENNKAASRDGSQADMSRHITNNYGVENEMLDKATTNINEDELMSKFLAKRVNKSNNSMRLFDEYDTHGAVAVLDSDDGVHITVVVCEGLPQQPERI